MQTNKTRLGLLIPLIMGLAPTCLVNAQESDSSASVTESIELEKIMVTAQKRGEDLQKVPLALSVIDGSTLERENLNTFQEMQFSVPNLSMVVTSPFTTTVNLRGIPSNPNGVFNSGTSPGLGVYVDGVVYSRATGFNQDLINIQQVEVLRGPQGTLFGQNTNLGVVNITTKKPSDLVEAKVKLDIGNYNSQRLSAYATGPLIEGKLAGSISVFNVDRDGYIKNLTDGKKLGDEDRFGGRAQLRFTPNEDLTIDLNVEKMEGDSLPPGGRLTDYALGLGYIGLLGQGNIPETFMDAGKYQTYGNTERYFAERDNNGIDATVAYQFANGFEIKSITAQKNYDAIIGMDSDNTSYDLSYSTEAEDNKQFTQEFQLISPADNAFRYVAGLYYLNNKAVNDQSFMTATGIYGIPTGLPEGYPQSFSMLPESGVILNGELETTSTAVFTNLSYDFSENMNAFLGLRYSDVEKAMQFSQDGWDTTLPGYYLLNYVDIPQTQQTKNDDFLSWTFGLSGALADNINAYTKVSRGYKEGGYSFRPQSIEAIGGDVTNPVMDFDREQVTSYEAGVKGTLLENRMRLNLAVFYLDYQDIQTRVVDDNGVNRVVNGPTSTSAGVEAELSYRVTQALSINANIGYADAKFGDFENCHSTDDCTDNQLPGAAKWTNSLGVKYSTEINDNWELFAGADYAYRSKIQSDARNLAATELDSSSLANARAGIISSTGEWEVMLWGKNILGDESLANKTDRATSDLSFSTELFAPPRMYGVTVTYNYF